MKTKYKKIKNNIIIQKYENIRFYFTESQLQDFYNKFIKGVKEVKSEVKLEVPKSTCSKKFYFI